MLLPQISYQQPEDLTFMNPKIYSVYDHIMGHASPYVITIEALRPDLEFIVRVTTSRQDFLINKLYVIENDKHKIWKKSDNIRVDLMLAGIHRDYDLPYKQGYIYIGKRAFWNTGRFMIRVDLLPYSKNLSPDYKGRQTLIKIDSNKGCYLNPRFTECSDPTRPLIVSVAQFYELEAHVDYCPNTKISFRWLAYDILGNEKLKEWEESRVPLLRIERFALNMRPSNAHEFDKYSIMIRVIADREAGHCYIDLVQGDVSAVIVGGNERDVNRYEVIYVNGSLSRELAEGEDSSNLDFLWSCYSSCDQSNWYCQKNMSSAKIIRIPRYTLKMDCSYKYTLEVSIDSKYASATQTLNVVKYRTVDFYILCLRNCAGDVYHPNEKVDLLAVCLDCGDAKIDYQWSVDNEIMIEDERLYVFLRTPFESVIIEVSGLTHDYRTNTRKLVLKKNFGPVGPGCSIEPETGQEFDTMFNVQCLNFKTNYNPKRFFIIAAKVIQEVFYSESMKLLLPVAKSITVRVCDFYKACNDVSVEVNVKEQYIPTGSTTNQTLEDFLSSGLTDVAVLFKRGYRNKAYIILNSAARRIKSVKEAATILRFFNNYQPRSVLELGKLANVTKSLAISLNPISDDGVRVLTKAVESINHIFAEITENGEIDNLREYPFRNVTVRCILIQRMFQNLTDKLPPPPQFIVDMVKPHAKLTSEHIAKVRKEIKQIPEKDVRLNTEMWLNATYNANRLYNYLFFTNEMGLGLDDDDGQTISIGVAMDVECVETYKEYILKSYDHINKVTFSVGLLEELSDKLNSNHFVCVRMVSIVRNLNWWYPDERQPSARLLKVRAFTNSSELIGTHKLNNKIEYITLIGKYKPIERPPDILSRNSRPTLVYRKSNEFIISESELEFNRSKTPVSSIAMPNRRKPARPHLGPSFRIVDEHSADRVSTEGIFENMVLHDQLTSVRDYKIYRVNIEAQGLLAVRFVNTTHDVVVKLQTVNQPFRDEIKTSSCIVYANETDRIMLLRNPCPKAVKAYMGLALATNDSHDLVNGSAEIYFLFQLRDCDYWMYNDPVDPHWSQYGCLPAMELDIHTGIICICEYLSTYTAYVYNVPIIPVPINHSTDFLNRNIYIAIFSCFWLSLILLILFVWCCSKRLIALECSRPDDEVEQQLFEGNEEHMFLIHLKTGGGENSGTTANVQIRFVQPTHEQVCYTISQDPTRPKLRTNTTHTLILRSRIIRLPTQLQINHDGGGRYSSWYLSSVVVQDVTTQTTQAFKIHLWLRTHNTVVSRGKIIDKQDRFVGRWCYRFKRSMERNCTNWFGVQPVIGSWRWHLGNRCFSRFERVCIFVNKLGVTVCIIVLYFGKDSEHNREMLFRKTRGKMLLPIIEIIYLSCVCYLASCIVQFFYEILLVKIARL
ncbi:uncharacterized protein LOC115625957 [Scaptodrosophila lebanonensis]|uniref:Uncharacterized protein LOC115625957 n=1 Tax=Drosophila lebanonensis TaxID=7225 RepID=A0A6J2TNG5_DROLE|nr:uncharacterized protein LOC115625957 [Scaptodrosophila lebanonensis]